MEFQTVVFSDGIRNSDSFCRRHHRQLIWILNSFACIRVIHKPNWANNLRRSDGSRSCWNWFRFDNSKNEDLFLSITDKKLRDKIQLVQTLDATIWWCACSQNKSPSGLSLRNPFKWMKARCSDPTPSDFSCHVVDVNNALFMQCSRSTC